MLYLSSAASKDKLTRPGGDNITKVLASPDTDPIVRHVRPRLWKFEFGWVQEARDLLDFGGRQDLVVSDISPARREAAHAATDAACQIGGPMHAKLAGPSPCIAS